MRKQRQKLNQLSSKELYQMLKGATGKQKAKIAKELERRKVK
jgi:hypothetical protein